MKRITLFILAVFFLSLSEILGQETDFSKNAEYAIRKGDYKEAETQYVAHKNALKAVFHKSENDKEVLLIEKKIKKIKDCIQLKAEADTYMSKAKQTLTKYNGFNVSEALYNNTVYDDMCSSFQESLDKLQSARNSLSRVCDVFKDDVSTRSLLAKVTDEISGVNSPNEKLKAVLFNNPSEEAVNNYLQRINANAETAARFQKDLNAWQQCLRSNNEYAAAGEYLRDTDNQLFRRNAQSIIDKYDDTALWNSVDKNSLASVNTYLKRKTTYKKIYQSEAEIVKKKLEDLEADKKLWSEVNKSSIKSLNGYIAARVDFQKAHCDEAVVLVKQLKENEAWSKVDKSSASSISAYLSSVKESGYKSAGEKLIDEILWNKVDHDDYNTLHEYLNTFPDYPKFHRQEALREYRVLYDETRWKSVDENSRMSLSAYIHDPKNERLEYKNKALAYLKIIDAHEAWYGEYKNAAKTYKLLKEARVYVPLSDEDNLLLDTVGEKVAYQAFISSKKYNDALAYKNNYPTGEHIDELNRWLDRYDSAMERAEKIECKTYQRTRSDIHRDYEQYRRKYDGINYSKLSPEDYINQLNGRKRSAIVDAGGHRLRWGFGIGGGHDFFENSFVFTFNGELRYGNVIQNVNLVMGVNLYMYFSEEESDDNFTYKDDPSYTMSECIPCMYVGPLFHVVRLGKSPTSSRLFFSPVVEYDFTDRSIGTQLRLGLTFGKTCELGAFYSKKLYSFEMLRDVVNQSGHRSNVVGADIRFNF